MSSTENILAPFGVLLFVAAIVILTYFFARRRRDADSSVRLAGATAPSDRDTSDGDEGDLEFGLDEATILSYPRIQYSQAAKDIGAADGGDGSYDSSCSICLSDYQDTDTVRVLPECKHFFHVKCVDPWLKQHSTCPICRKQQIAATDGDNPLPTRRSRHVLFIRR
ncbi:hypothetical protein SAY87_019289 [Trapa incisa]|uniref:RING-type E3 ubiquitin transferase n=1 Tax=Trapa incisa TaxID=236973 RepID=A0AAN7K5H9_9MYRT|nr:hypothetical protein SAY87_019289 [Trapa incisa]